MGRLLCVLLSLVGSALANTQANCTYEDIRGTWTFSIGSGGHSRSLSCHDFKGPVKSKVEITLQYPDIAVDQFGNVGFWTLIYNQGFEVVVAGRKYFAFSFYVEHKNHTYTSLCHELFPGWSHDVLGHDWACYTGVKAGNARNSGGKVSQTPSLSSVLKFEQSIFYNDMDFIDRINSVQTSWKAGAYPELEGLTREQIFRRQGGPASRVAERVHPVPGTPEVHEAAAKLPENFDWRNVVGVNYVSPVRDQGCQGGFAYLIGDKYAEDFGLVLESANPYKGSDHSCSTPASAKRHYSTKYEHIGGYYGACNEPLMRLALYENGPLAVSFEVYRDFGHYRGGIYHHTGLNTNFNPFHLTSHAVLVVGYGVVKSTGEKYWSVKNSWGENWGEKGYFRIRRGTDECALESMAVQSTPIIPL